MKIPKRKIWTTFFFKSFVWLILPFCILGNIKSCSTYIEAGKHLTPSSVSVRGYYRRDGTYIHPYNRRPPGGARHDVPYESTRTPFWREVVVTVIVGLAQASVPVAQRTFCV